MKIFLKSLCIFLLTLADAHISITAENVGTTSPEPAKEIMAWVSPESPAGIWLKGYGQDFPADYMLKKLSEAGYTDIELAATGGRGIDHFYHDTKVQFAGKCPYMGDRDWMEEAFSAADKYNIKVWLVLTPNYKVKGSDIAGLDDPRHLKIWTEIVDEYGMKYKPRHKSLVGIYVHEVDCAEILDTHIGDLDKFSAFCKKTFGETYGAPKMPDGQGGTKWDRRYFLYKNDVVTTFTRTLREAAAKYGMETTFCLYPPEQFSSNSALWGYDVVALEKNSDRIWVVVQAEYRDLKRSWQDTGPSYRGTNVPYHETMAFHGKSISIFESRFLLFPEVMRKYYSQNREFTKVNGDIFNGYLQKSERIVKLFTGFENVRNWNALHKKWIGAESKAKIAVIASPVPFVIRFPTAPGVEYKKVFTSLLDLLKRHYVADAQIAGTEFTLNPENLLKYDLIIIPEEMGVGLDKAFYENLKTYLAKGGKLIAIGTPVSTGSPDLEHLSDHMDELFGINIGNGKPVMAHKGNAYYLASAQGPENEKILLDLINKISPQPAYLDDNSGLRLSSIIKSGNMLCVSLPSEKKAAARLCVDTERLGLSGERFEVRNIIIGKTLCSVSSKELKAGVKVVTDYDSEPYVLAIGAVDALAQFTGIYPDNRVFADMGRISTVENPEVAIAVPDKPGIKVGIYQNSYGGEKIYAQLSKMPDFNCFYLPRLDSECMSHADVLIIPQAKSPAFFSNAANEIRNVVGKGKGAILTHDAAAEAKEIFPGLVNENKGKIMKIKDNGVTIAAAHPGTGGLKAGDTYMPGFAFDHYAFAPGKGVQVLAKDFKGNNVILAGDFEKGRVVLYGTLPGVFCPWDDCSKFLENRKLEGEELQLLADSVKWLAGAGKKEEVVR